MTEPVEIDIADVTTEIASINGFWHWPVSDEGEQDGRTTYVPFDPPITGSPS